MSDYPIHGKTIEQQSIDERVKLVQRADVNNSSELWHLVNFASFVFFQEENTALTISQLLNSIGVKIISSNVALSSLNNFPNYVGYTPQNKERVLLIAQTNPLQNGFYEWQTGGNLVRLYDWRDIIAGNGVAINANNIVVKLLEYLTLPLPPFPQIPLRNDNFLQFDNQGNLFARIASDAVGLKLNANRELFIDGAELGGGGGGASSLDIPHPDIDSVTGNNVLLVGTSGTINVNGGNFRRDATVISDGFTVTNYVNRGWNINSAVIQATNLIGIHNVLVKHLTLDSEDTGKQRFTVLGAAIIDTVLPRAKRNTTTVITVTGVGFALLSTFVANNAGITINLLSVTDRFLVTIQVSVANGVNSGLYNLICTNFFTGLGTFTSGTSGNNKLVIFGDPIITTVFRSPEGSLRVAEVLLGETMEITANGFDLTNDFAITPNSIATNGITLNSISGLSTKKLINVTGSSNIADIGVYDLTCNDTINSGNSGTTGHGKVALNYAYSATNIRLPQVFRAFGGAVLSDWLITQNVGSVTVERIGGSGMAFLEATDLFFVASLLRFGLGNVGSYLNFTVETLANDMPLNAGNNGIFICIAPIGATITNPQNLSEVDCFWRVSQGNSNTYRMDFASGNFTEDGNTPNLSILMQEQFTNNSTNFVPLKDNNSLGFSNLNKLYTSHANKAVHIAMSGNFKLNFHLRGWIGE